ncbi:hypothetical protein BER2_1679 [plant metagenome]|uniref:Ead/Ea22-like family protein n=1 Tax=plant metagenome TaxID=1297885 RepID=A0A484R2M8_9ZZZZ
MTVDTQKLRELIAKATTGEWRQSIRPDAIVADTPAKYAGDADRQAYGGYLIAESISAQNIALIAGAINALPALLDALERKDAEIARLREALEPFVASNCSGDEITITVKTADVARARATLSTQTEQREA